MREVFETPGHVLLDVRIPEGTVDVATTEADRTVVELTGPDDDELRDLARIDCRERDGRYEVDVTVDDRRGLGFGLRFLMQRSYRLEVTLPPGADLRVSTGSADLRARGHYGLVDVESGSGDVEVEQSAGNASVKSASGDVLLRAVDGDVDVSTASGDVNVELLRGSGRIRCASGDVRVAEAASELTVQTASGDQEIGSVADGRVTLQSASGDMRIGIKQGSRVWVDAKSMSGDTSSELELGDAPEATGEEEGPLVELRATAMSGDIRVVRA
jgi:DUF4097 and DUF4098 domain-containing protein YvlB